MSFQLKLTSIESSFQGLNVGRYSRYPVYPDLLNATLFNLLYTLTYYIWHLGSLTPGKDRDVLISSAVISNVHWLYKRQALLL